MSSPTIYINGKNARTQWGVLTTANTLSTLLAPVSLKERVSNESRLEHGKRMDNTNPKVASRDLNLGIQVTQEGTTDMYLSDRPTVVYHFLYISCTQYTQFRRGIATLSLKVTEYNPKDRTAHND